MPLAIVTSDEQSRHSHLLTLNIVGVLIFTFIEVLLVLTALGVIFEEPDITPVMEHHLKQYALSCLAMKERNIGFDVPCREDQDFEELYLYYINNSSSLLR